MEDAKKNAAVVNRASQVRKAAGVSPGRDRPMTAWHVMRARLDAVTADDVEECKALYESLEATRIAMGLKRWSSLQRYVGPIPRCVKAVGGKSR